MLIVTDVITVRPLLARNTRRAALWAKTVDSCERFWFRQSRRVKLSQVNDGFAVSEMLEYV
jgi:hypothetical protein